MESTELLMESSQATSDYERRIKELRAKIAEIEAKQGACYRDLNALSSSDGKLTRRQKIREYELCMEIYDFETYLSILKTNLKRLLAAWELSIKNEASNTFGTK